MDLMQPSVRQQPAPARWLRPGAAVDVPRFIQEAMSRDPNATADTIRAELAKRRIGMPAIVVAAWMEKLKK
jgi:hypothetical protein